MSLFVSGRVTMAGSVPTVALVSQSSVVSQKALGDYVPPLQQWVERQVNRYWHVNAMVVATASPPFGAWPFIFRDGLDEPGAAAYHTDDNGQPQAVIDTADEPLFNCSHELGETLKDPSGDHLYTAPSPDPADNGRPCQILLELCDPCEDPRFALTVDGVRLSDFITHQYGNGNSGPYSASGGLTAAREVGPNGYISYVIGGAWKQITNFDGEGWRVRALGPAGQAKREGKSLREWVDEHTRRHRATLKESR